MILYLHILNNMKNNLGGQEIIGKYGICIIKKKVAMQILQRWVHDSTTLQKQGDKERGNARLT